jgi:hypothetical protein
MADACLRHCCREWLLVGSLCSEVVALGRACMWSWAIWRGRPSHQPAHRKRRVFTIHNIPHRRSDDRGPVRPPLICSRNGYKVVRDHGHCAVVSHGGFPYSSRRTRDGNITERLGQLLWSAPKVFTSGAVLARTQNRLRPLSAPPQ